MGAQTKNVPWVEKYRPKNISEVAHQTEVISVLKKAVTTDNLPHLLFHGPPGTGKTSTILAMAQQLFGPKMYKDRVLEMNASDERGIKTVREKVKSFARLATGKNLEADSEYPCPPFKLIVLDEADSMTYEAQAALRRVMEQYCKVTRFCIVCNYVSKIIEPLTSRCAKFRFQPVSDEAHSGKLQTIMQAEGINPAQGVMDALLYCAQGDLRKSITLLQSVHTFDDQVSAQRILDIAGDIPPQVLDKLVEVLKEGDVQKAHAAAREVVADAYPVKTLCERLIDRLYFMKGTPKSFAATIALVASKADEHFAEGCDEQLQFVWVCGSIATAIKAAQ